MSNINKPKNSKLDAIVSRAVASQIPTNVTRESFIRMESHAMMQSYKHTMLWACKLNGARIKARMVFRMVYEFGTDKFLQRAPVVELYCSGCDKAPTTPGDAPIYDKAIQTVSM